MRHSIESFDDLTATLEAEEERPMAPVTPGIRAVRDPLAAESAFRRLWRAIAVGALGLGLLGAAFVLVGGEVPVERFETVFSRLASPNGEEGSAGIASVPRVDGSISVRTVPAGADIAVNSNRAGRTPMLDREVATGTHMLSIRMDGFEGVDTLVMVRAGEDHDLVLALRPRAAGTQLFAAEVPQVLSAEQQRPSEEPEPQAQAVNEETSADEVREGTLTIFSEPAGAEVVVGESRLGRTPLRGVPLPEGTHDVQVMLPNHESAEQTVSVRADESTTLSVELDAQRGNVRVLVLPWGSIYVDGSLRHEDTDLRHVIELAAGSHIIRGVHPVLGSIEREVRIVPGETADVVIDFND